MSDRYKGAILSPTAPTVIPQSAGGVYTLSQQTQYQGQGVWPSAINNPVTNSLRFRSSASAYLNRTLTTPTSSQKFTWSGWVKRGKLDASGYQGIFAPYSSGTVYGYIAWSQDGIRIYDRLSGGTNYLLQTTAVYRDPSAWYHIVYAVDTTQATASNRVRLYVNGVEVTSFSTSTYPTQNNSTTTNSAIAHYIGYDPSNTGYLDGYLAEVNFIDGTALTPSSFGTTDAYGIWQPIPYTGTYGTNGFYLPFTDVATTSGSNAGLGKDFSGNGNYWTTNNISVTTGTTYDSMSDVPTLTSATAANYCTLNPLDRNTNLALSNGNLTAIPSSTADYWLGRATMQLPSTGKWYWELTLNNTPYLYQAGIYSANRPNSGQTSATGNEYQVAWGTAFSYIMYQSNNAAFAAWGTNTNPTSGDVLMFAVDSNSGTMWVGRNGTWYNTSGTANPATNTDPRFSSIPSGLFAGVNLPNPASGGVSMNFGQQGFAYTPPSGFYPLNTYNLPTPTILEGGEYMNVVTWTGNGTSSGRSITGVGFQPDFVWGKARSVAYGHGLYDAVRGTGKLLVSNNTNAEATNFQYGYISSFDSDGFSTTAGSSSNENWNQTNDTYVAWNWKASNAAGVSNTQGTITSTVSANTTAGFSVVTYTGNGTSGATVGHGLGVAPSMVIVKSRSAANNWCVYHISVGNQYATLLNSTASSYSNSNYWNNTSPTSTLFSLGNGNDTNQSSATFVAYCFAQVAGYSAFGSYTGNGSSDGPFVFLGFRPRYVMIKCSSSDQGGNAVWGMFDTARNTYNVANNRLYADGSAAESTSPWLDINSNGFKIRETSTSVNGSSATYIYMAFAENPFKIARAR